MTEKEKVKKEQDTEKKESEEEKEQTEENILKNKKVLATIAVIAVALIIINIYIFTSPRQGKACYADLCIYSNERNPEEHFEQLLQTSESSYLLMEGDIEITEKTGQVAHAAVKMSQLLTVRSGLDEEDIYSIGHENGEPKKCNGSEKPLEYCQNIEPGENQLLLHMKYPNYEDQEINKVIIENRTITIKAKTGQDLTATTEFLKMKFL